MTSAWGTAREQPGEQGDKYTMSDEPIIPVPTGIAENAWADQAKYQEMYRRLAKDGVPRF